MKRKANLLRLWRRKQSVRPEDSFCQGEADPGNSQESPVPSCEENSTLKNRNVKEQEAELEARLINFHIQENRKAHKTDEYETELLLLRIGQVFDITVKFNRDYNPESDVMTLLFITDKKFHQEEVATVQVEFRYALLRSNWGMQIKEANGNTVRLSVMSSAEATAGCYNVRVQTKSRDCFRMTSLYQLKNAQQICFMEDN